MKNPLKLLRVFYEKEKPKNIYSIPSSIKVIRDTGVTTYAEEYFREKDPLPPIVPLNADSMRLASQGHHLFLMEWKKGQEAAAHKGIGYVYVLKGSKPCSISVPTFEKKATKKKFYDFILVGRVDQIYSGMDDSIMTGARAKFTKGGVPSLTLTRIDEDDAKLRETLSKMYPPTVEELAQYKSLQAGERPKWLEDYNKKKAILYADAASPKINFLQPSTLYYNNKPIGSFKNLKGEKLSIAKEYADLNVATVKDVESLGGDQVLFPSQEVDAKGDPIWVRVYQVTHMFPEKMNEPVSYYGLQLPSENATVTDLKYPLIFDLLDFEEEDDDDNDDNDYADYDGQEDYDFGKGLKKEKKEEKEDADDDADDDKDAAAEENLSNTNVIEFADEPEAQLKGASADLNALVGNDTSKN